jgi:hypothetical protein
MNQLDEIVEKELLPERIFHNLDGRTLCPLLDILKENDIMFKVNFMCRIPIIQRQREDSSYESSVKKEFNRKKEYIRKERYFLNFNLRSSKNKNKFSQKIK